MSELKTLTKEERAAFIAFIAPFAQDSMKATGVPASVTMAQAILESSWGQKADGYNYFGIKNWSEKAKLIRELLWHGQTYSGELEPDMQLWWTREVINGKSIRVQDVFMKYNSPKEGFDEHGNFLVRNKRYSKAFQCKNADGKTDALAFVDAIANAGYATDPNYARTLKTLIKQYDLTKYD